MTRTTLNIDAPLLKDLKRRQKLEHKSLGRIVSELLAESLAQYETKKPAPPPFKWLSKSMGARVDLVDKEAIYEAMEKPRELAAKRRRRS